MEENKKVIAVIDMKSFYSYVECVDRGLDPWKTPLVVADVERSVNTIILSVSPYLKSKGVPSRLRLKELPKGFNYIYATPRMSRYIEMSSKIVSIFLDFISSEDLHVYSIDESFLDLTTYINYYKKSPKEIVQMIMNKVKEETGIEIENIRYCASQAWPYPDQLMIGLRADWKSGELILQESEIDDAKWFSKDNLPPIPKAGSLAYQLINGII